jgi:hypothetical protein
VLTRTEALQLMDAIAKQSNASLLLALGDLVEVGAGGQAQVDAVEALAEDCERETARLAELKGRTSAGAPPPPALAECARRLADTIRKAAEQIGPANKTASTYDDWSGGLVHNGSVSQDILRKLGFHRCVVSLDDDEDDGPSGVLSVLAYGSVPGFEPPRLGERLSGYYAAARGWLCAEEVELVNVCFLFLKRFCHGNKANQLELGTGVMSWAMEKFFGSDLGELAFLNAFFDNNRPLARAISKPQVGTLCRMVHWDAAKVAERSSGIDCINILTSLVRTEGASISENQDACIQALLRGDAGCLDRAFWYRKDAVYLNDNLSFVSIDPEYTAPAQIANRGSRVSYHIALMHLLAECAHANEDVCEVLREVMPLGMFVGSHAAFTNVPPGVLSRAAVTGGGAAQLPGRLLGAYIHIFQVLITYGDSV